MQSQLRMLKVSFQLLRASGHGACPASLSALALPSTNWSVSWFNWAPCFSACHHVALMTLALSLGCPPHRLGQAALGAPGHAHHLGWTSPAPTGICSEHPGALCLVLPQCTDVWLESGGSEVEAVLCCRLWSEQRVIISPLSHPAVLLSSSAVLEPAWLPRPTAQSLDWTGNYIFTLNKVHKGELIISHGKALHKSLIEATLRYKFAIAISYLWVCGF